MNMFLFTIKNVKLCKWLAFYFQENAALINRI